MYNNISVKFFAGLSNRIIYVNFYYFRKYTSCICWFFLEAIFLQLHPGGALFKFISDWMLLEIAFNFLMGIFILYFQIIQYLNHVPRVISLGKVKGIWQVVFFIFVLLPLSLIDGADCWHRLILLISFSCWDILLLLDFWGETIMSKSLRALLSSFDLY